MSYIIPLIFITVILLSVIRKQDPYSLFIQGSSSSLKLMMKVFPYLVTVMIAVEVFRISGVSGTVAGFISPAMNFVGIPAELTELILIRPLSGAGSLAVLENIFATYGADSDIGRAASVVYGSSETIFYISAVYFSQTKVKRLGFAIPIALISTFAGSIVGVFFVGII
ncbi:MAG: spore maturation protein [Firmicutes bacterium]|nr:spore maturation protein [Bacillota bacterium]